MTTASPLPLPRAARSPLSVALPLKDLDALGFVGRLPATERARWWDWAARLRRADELAEGDTAAFAALRAAWEASRDFGPPGEQRVADAWSRYLAALADYHAPWLVIRTLDEHDEMLLRLSGPLLQLAPGMPEELWESAAAFGALDQFYNNLRDLQEDAERGLCWLPEDVLREHGIAREDVIAGRAPEMRGWIRFSESWHCRHLPEVRERASAFLDAALPPSLEAMRRWTIDRYCRISTVYSCTAFDYRRFPAVYWAEVRRELERAEEMR